MDKWELALFAFMQAAEEIALHIQKLGELEQMGLRPNERDRVKRMKRHINAAFEASSALASGTARDQADPFLAEQLTAVVERLRETVKEGNRILDEMANRKRKRQ